MPQFSLEDPNDRLDAYLISEMNRGAYHEQSTLYDGNPQTDDTTRTSTLITGVSFATAVVQDKTGHSSITMTISFSPIAAEDPLEGDLSADPVDYYLVSYSYDNTNWLGETSTTVSPFVFHNLITGKTLYARVRAVSVARIYGSYSTFNTVLPVDTTPPPAPSPPTLNSTAGGLGVTWNGTFAGAAPRPDDFAFVEVQSTTDVTFATGVVNRGHLDVNGYTSFQVTASAGVTTYVRLVAYDFTGNQSAPSTAVNQIIGAVTPADIASFPALDAAGNIAVNAVGSPQLAALAVIAGKIAAGAVTPIKTALPAIDSVTGNLTANSVSAINIIGGTVTTDKLSVASLGLNLIANGDFEEGALNSWTTGYEVTGSPPSFVIDNNVAVIISGVYAATVNNLGNTQGTSMASRAFPVKAGDLLYVSAHLRQSGTAFSKYVRMIYGTADGFIRSAAIAGTPAVPINVQILDVNGNFVSTPASTSSAGIQDLIGGASLPANSTWYQLVGQVLVPAGATWARLIFYSWAQGVASFDTFDLADVRKVTVSAMIGDGQVVAPKIGTGTLNATTVITIGTSSTGLILNPGAGYFIKGISAGTTTFYVDTAGNVAISGTVNASSGTFSGTISASGTISGGNITGAVITGSTIRTAASGQRVQMDTTNIDRIKFFSGDVNETTYGMVDSAINGSAQPYLFLSSPALGSHFAASMSMTGMTSTGVAGTTTGISFDYPLTNLALGTTKTGNAVNGNFVICPTGTNSTALQFGSPTIDLGVTAVNGGNGTWTFPQTFSSAPTCIVGNLSKGSNFAGMVMTYTFSTSSTSFRLNFNAAGTSTGVQTLSMIAMM